MYFSKVEVVGVLNDIICAVLLISSKDFTNSGIYTSREGMAGEAGF
jgi:hypothetical protein